MRRQFLEVFKVFAIGFGFSWLFSIIRYSQDGDIQVLLQSLLLFPLIVWLVLANFPLAVLWLAWLAWAHVVAVRAKYFQVRNDNASKIVRLVLNRPVILGSGLICLLLSNGYRDSYGITFVIFLDLVYLTYIGVSKIRKR